MRNPLVRTIAIACLAGSAALAVAASASAAAPHPRIFLDSGTLTRLHPTPAPVAQARQN